MGFNIHLGMGAKALITGIICGLVGVLVDIDHIPLYIFNIPVEPIFVINGFFDTPIFSSIGRPMHPFITYISLTTFICIVGLLLQYSIRSTAKSVTKIVVTAVQNAISPVPATE